MHKKIKLNHLTLIAILGLILSFYIWIASESRGPYVQYSPAGWYNLLTDGFVSGMLNIPVEPDPRIFTLQNPYDPVENAPVRLHDISFYKGKFYLYYGVTPVVVLYLPYRLLTGKRLPENYAAVFFTFGSVIWALLFMFHVHKTYFNQVPLWMLYLSVAVLGFANGGPYNLIEPLMYQNAITSGAFFSTGAVYWASLSISRTKPAFWMIILASFFMGFAIGARPFLFMFAVILLPLIWLKLTWKKNIDKTFKYKLLLSMFIPLGICLFLLAIYNYLRFENPFEFGFYYQMAGLNTHDLKFFYLGNLLPGLYYLLFEKPHFNYDLPFIHIANRYLPSGITWPSFYVLELIVGVLYSIPLFFMVFIGPILYWITKTYFSKGGQFRNNVLFKTLFSLLVIELILHGFYILFNKNILRKENLGELYKVLSQFLTWNPLLELFVLLLLINIIIWMINIKITEKEKIDVYFPRYEFLMVFLPALCMLGFFITYSFVTMRYYGDFGIYVVLVAIIVWFYFYSVFSLKLFLGRFIKYIGSILCLISIIFGMAFGTGAYFARYRSEKPNEYSKFRKVERFFKPVADILVKFNSRS